MTRPVRLQLSRKRGFNLQALSLATNGLEAVVVDRRTMWGNPFKVTPSHDAAAVCAEFRAYVTGLLQNGTGYPLAALTGKNLACTCKLPDPGQPDLCHASILLELANAPR